MDEIRTQEQIMQEYVEHFQNEQLKKLILKQEKILKKLSFNKWLNTKKSEASLVGILADKYGSIRNLTKKYLREQNDEIYVDILKMAQNEYKEYLKNF
jgi:hypothetical protein